MRLRNGPKESLRTRSSVCVVGSGWHFYSGISLFTCRRANAFAGDRETSAILMRKLVPKALYPGAERVGQSLGTATYRSDVEVLDGVDYYWLPGLVRAAAFLLRRRPDVLVMQWWTGAVLHSYLAIAALARLSGSRIVLEFHEIQDSGEARSRLARAYVDRLIAPLLAMTSGIVVHSRYDESAVRARFDLGGMPVRVIPHGPFDHLAAPDAAAGTPPERDAGAPYRFLYFGTIRPYKGLEHLVEAFNRLTPEQAGRVHLVVVGETWEGWTKPAQLIAASPHRDRITFVNRYVHDDEAARHFAEADAVVLPYLRSSASGPLHLAMSHGLPVAVSRVGGLHEAAGDYAGAQFVRPGSAEDLAAVLREFPDRPRQRYADPHSWVAGAERFDELFRDLPAVPAGRLRIRHGAGPARPGEALDGRSVAPVPPQRHGEASTVRPTTERVLEPLGSEDAARN